MSLANGSTVSITQSVDLDLTIAHRKESVTLKVLRGDTGGVCSILFGRELIDRFSLVIHGCSRVTMDRACLFDRTRDVICFLDDGDEAEAAPPKPAGLHEIESAPAASLDVLASEMMTLPVTDDVAAAQDAILEDLCHQPPSPMAFCLGVKIGLRPLREDEAKDTPGQRFVFEVDAPRVDPSKSAPRLYAASCLARLPPQRREEFDALVEGYVATGWWAPCDRRVALAEYGHPANIFGVMQRGKLRLVADFRQLNLFFAASTRMPSIHDSLLSLTLCARDGLIVGDCKSAFLKVRLKRPLWLHTGRSDFLTTRMAFGLSYGPEGLRCSAGRLWELFKGSMSIPGAGSLFVDDWFITARSDEVLESAGAYLSLLDKCGFDCSRKKFSIVKGSGAARLFNCTVELETDRITVKCERGQRMEEVKRLLARDSWTKAAVFGLAGLLAYDVSGQHTASRLAGDLLRSVIGSACASLSWHSPIRPDALSNTDRLLFRALLDWSAELATEACDHSMAMPADRGDDCILFLRLQVDASFHGHGACLFTGSTQDGPWTLVRKECAVWKKRELNFSINRLEATALFRALRSVSFLIEHAKDSLFNPGRSRIELIVESDNAPSICWATKGTANVSSTSPEFRAISRLSCALDEEMHVLNKLCSSVALRHVPGADNAEADGLSRLLERQVGTDPECSIGSLYRERTLSWKKKPKSSICTDIVASVEESPRFLAEELAVTTYDIVDLNQRFAGLRRILRFWRDVSHQERAGASGTPTNPTLDLLAPFGADDELALASSINPTRDPTICFKAWDGQERSLLYISKQCPTIQDKVLRFYHRLNAHRGARHLLADLIKDGKFHLEGARTLATRLCRNCPTCSKKNASNNATPPVMPTQTFPRDTTFPVFTRVAIDHLFTRPLSLSILCMDTGYLSLQVVQDKTTKLTVEALQKVAHRYSVSFRLVHSDNYSSFASPALLQSLRRLGHSHCQASFAPPAASNLNPIERYHKEVWSTLRCRKFCARLSTSMKDGVDEALDGVCYIVNSRPLALQAPDLVITPAVLAFGVPGTPAATTKRFAEVRELFYDQFFDQLRRRFSDRQQRKSLIRVNQLVLARCHEDAPKDEMKVEVGRIVGVNRAEIEVKVRGKIFKLSSTQVVPLSLALQTSTPGEGTLQADNRCLPEDSED